MQERAATAIAVVITIVWAISSIADIAMSTYEPPAAMHPIMLALVGSFFTVSVVRRNGGSNGKP